MLDFLEFEVSVPKQGLVVLKPDFRMDIDSEDLMIRGGDFYAIWDESSGYWSKSEKIATRLIDRELAAKANELREKFPDSLVKVHYMKSASSGSIDRWHKYVQKQARDSFKTLDKKIIFANTKVKKKDYVSQEKILDYPLEDGPIEAYDELMGTLYEPAERQKLEWAIGAIVCGDSKKIQKFEVLYGAAGTGKSTVLNIIDDLFGDYVSVFNAKELASVSNAFSLESFASDPLVTIQHDGDLSRIEDNTKLNSVVSHETLPVNTKYGKIYNARFETFIFMGTNNPVKITDAKSGLLRRLIDVNPSGRKVPAHRYDELLSQIKFEKGAIAWHCLQVYKELGRHYYDTYVPTKMMGATNDFYNFVEYNYDLFKRENKITAKNAWALYDEYCEYANARKISYTPFKMELSNYFKEFYERKTIDGHDYRCLYSGFRTEKFESNESTKPVKASEKKTDDSWLKMTEQSSYLDIVGRDWPAQYSKADGSPEKAWSRVNTTLKDLSTKSLHWLKPPEEVKLIVIDFDIPDGNGKKSFELNYEAARKWPKTYAELSKSGEGIHLHYFYTGDVKTLSRIFDEHIEIKIFTGGSSLRRQLSKCNNIPIATISSGLPLKGEANKVVNWEGIKNERMLRTMIIRNLNKEYHPDTTSSIDYIKYLLDQAYESGVEYDVSDMQQRVVNFALNSTNQSQRCIKTVGEMQFRSKENIQEALEKTYEEVKAMPVRYSDDRFVFFDCEVYSNFFCIVWKYAGSDTCVHMVNPTPEEVEALFHYKLVGFNCRQYDNHILYARSLGYSNEQLYELSQQIINYHKGFFSQAYDVSSTDVYDFCTEKMSLKKWEIKLGISHQEMGIPWDQPVPEDRMEEVVGYCENDVRATEAVFNARQGDFMARQIQVALVGLLHGEEVAA